MNAEPIMRAKICPDELLPGSAATMLKLALASGWDAHATIAIGAPDDADLAHQSVIVWCRRRGIRIHASWERPIDRSKPYGFRTGWRTPGILGWPDRLNFAETKSALK